MLRTGVSMLSAFDKELNDYSHDANVRKSIRLIARVSTLITDGWRISHGEKPFPEKPELTLAANFFYKFNGKIPEQWQTRMLDTIFNLYADHDLHHHSLPSRHSRRRNVVRVRRRFMAQEVAARPRAALDENGPVVSDN